MEVFPDQIQASKWIIVVVRDHNTFNIKLIHEFTDTKKKSDELDKKLFSSWLNAEYK